MAYSQEEKDKIVKEVLEKVSKGMSLRSALKSGKYPARQVFLDWIDADKSKQDQYARAIEERADAKFDSIEQDYLEEPQRDPMTGKIDPGWVNLQRLKIDAKKWELAKLFPKKYGDKIENTHVFETPIFKGIDLDVPKDNGTS